MSVLGLSCIQCGVEYPLEPLFYGCTSCDSANQAALTVTYDYKAIASKLNIDQWAKSNRGIWRFDALLPLPFLPFKLFLLFKNNDVRVWFK